VVSSFSKEYIMGRMVRFCAAILILCGFAIAQDSRPQFEVASVKPAAPDARGMWIRPGPGGGISISNLTLKEMITIAWRIFSFQVSGGPGWADSIRYDVVAKPETKGAFSENWLMLQALLADRFQLVMHVETKEMPVYALVIARKDGKLGPGLVETKEGSCAAPEPNQPPPPVKPGEKRQLPCGSMMMSPRSVAGSDNKVAELAQSLSRLLGRTVIDKTGLTAKYNYTLEWTPDESQAFQLPPDAPKPAADASGPSLFSALQEQLGLKLESEKGPVEIHVIDRTEKPSEN
jgi:uncharacterized protein (TIGR03435 family)